MRPRRLTLAANNGEVGGGEVMLLATARAARGLGWEVHVVGPATDAASSVTDAARAEDFPVTVLPGDRRRYLRALRAWDRSRHGLLWCHGLVPALATAGHRHRIVHLHQSPTGFHRPAATLARQRCLVTLVPSQHLAQRIPGAQVLWNWCDPITTPASARSVGGALRVGFLGRLSADKGVPVLADALVLMDVERPGSVRGIFAGEPLFVADDQRAAVDTALTRAEHLVDRVGWVAREDLLGGVDVAAFPSTWGEPFGLVVTESMSARVPVVVSDAGALPEVVGPDHPWVARAGDAADLARVIHQVQSGDPRLVREITDAAYRRWREHFSPEAGLRRVGQVLDSLAPALDDLGG